MHEVEILEAITELKKMILALASTVGEIRSEMLQSLEDVTSKLGTYTAPVATNTVSAQPTADFTAITDEVFLVNKCNKKVYHNKVNKWEGDNYFGTMMSDCPADYLEKLADQAEYFAILAYKNNEMDTNPNTGKSSSKGDNLKWYAKSARGWAAYKRKNANGSSKPASADFPF